MESNERGVEFGGFVGAWRVAFLAARDKLVRACADVVAVGAAFHIVAKVNEPVVADAGFVDPTKNEASLHT